MYHSLIILAIIFSLFLEKTSSQTFLCPIMLISDALPVQFWLTGCATYNEHLADGVHHKCFCAPWECDDEIRVQLTDTESNEYALQVVDENEDELFQTDFVNNENSSVNLMPELSLFENEGGGLTAWTEGATPSVTIVGIGSSQRLSKAKALSSGKYRINFSVSFGSSTSSSLRFYSQGILIETVSLHSNPPHTSPRNESTDFTLGSDIDTITFFALNSFAGSRTVTILNVDLFKLTYSYTASFTPFSEGICSQSIKLRIMDTTASPDNVVVAKSDCLDIQQQHDNTVLLTYSNHRNFAGLVYENISPDIEFQIRIPAIFFHQRFPEEDEVMERSDSLVTLNGTLRGQRLLDTDYLPYYFHKKVKLILKHQILTIFSRLWVKQEAYEIVEGDRRWPVKKAKCWLSEKDFVHRNIL